MEESIWHVPYRAEQIQAAIGKEPRISKTTGNWEIWDVLKMAYVDTGKPSKGDKGDKGEGISEEEADNKYLKLTGGKLTGAATFEIGDSVNIVEGDLIQIMKLGSSQSTIIKPGFIEFNESGKIAGLRKPEEDNEAATKKYVDDNSGISKNDADERYFPIEGGTIGDGHETVTIGKGEIEVGIYGQGETYQTACRIRSSGMIVARPNIAMAQLGDDRLVFYGGGPGLPNTFFIGMGADKGIIKGLSEPVDNNDAANKKYVDDTVAAAGLGEPMTNEEIDDIMSSLM